MILVVNYYLTCLLPPKEDWDTTSQLGPGMDRKEDAGETFIGAAIQYGAQKHEREKMKKK